MDKLKNSILNPDKELISYNRKFLESRNALFNYKAYGVNAFKILINSKLWFGEIRTQKDPFEGEFIIKNTSDSISQTNIDILRKFIGSNFEKAIEYTVKNKPAYYNAIVNSYLEHRKSRIKESYGVCSFSRTYKNQLLWSLYTDNHKGICFVFDKKPLLESLLEHESSTYSLNAKYENKIPVQEIDFNSNALGIDELEVLRHKHAHFKAEKETRFLIHYFSSKIEDTINHDLRKNNKTPDYKTRETLEQERAVKYNPKALRAVILGINMDLKNRRAVVNLLKNDDRFKTATIFLAEKNARTREVGLYCPELYPRESSKLFEDFGVTPRLR